MTAAPVICLHGPESTGKSTLLAPLAAELGAVMVPEYGRTFAELHGTDFTMADLVTIAREHDLQTRAARASSARCVLTDTDPLMTAVWADMLFDRRDPWFDRWANVADLYLLLDIDLPWVSDGTRMFGSAGARRRFFDLSRAELDRRGVQWTLVGGRDGQRLANAIAAIRAAGF